ncbi:MAG TPA: alkaline phosphatase family protein [Acidimicrobiia bacterium]|jgi:hypothetical protein
MSHQLPAEHEAEAEAALDVLLDTALEPVVDMVLLHRDGAYEARAHDGSVRFARTDSGFEVLATDGRDPLADQGSDKFAGIDTERAHKHPVRADNQYPHAFDSIAQLFDSPATPDLCVIHSARHNWEDQGGHLGEHGSLGVVQARAPFVIGGKGVRELGVAPRSMRLVDVAPTVAALLGCAPLDDSNVNGNPRFVANQDGEARFDLIDERERPRHVVGFLFDGTNPNVLYDMAARGEAPNVARIIAMGTAMGHGAMASLPTITLANHTTIITGRHPGRHGILNNAWYDRTQGKQVITNSNATWPWAMQSLEPGTESIHLAVRRTWDDAFSASVNEPCDHGAQYSTFDFFRRGEVPPIPKRADYLPHTSHNFVRPSKDYSWSSIVDHMAVDQAVGIWSGHYRDVSYPLPRFCWVNFTLTDAAMHEGGPHSEMAAASIRDSDGRIGEIMAAVEQAGVFDDTAFVLMADHGMEETDPTCRGDWDVALVDAGVKVRDEAYGFLYFGVDE